MVHWPIIDTKVDGCLKRNLDKFIKERGFILHLTTFNGKWPEKNLNHILKFKKKNPRKSISRRNLSRR